MTQKNAAISGKVELSAFAEIDDKGVILSANESFYSLAEKLGIHDVIGASIEAVVPGAMTEIDADNGSYITLAGRTYYLITSRMYSPEGLEEKRPFVALLDSEDRGKEENGQPTAELLREDLMEVLEGSFDGILVTDGSGNILYVNDSYERVAEIAKSDMEGRNMRDLINPEWMPKSVVFAVAERREPVSIRQVVKSGRHIIVTGRPVFDKDGQIKMIIVNARDITEIYDLSEELMQSKQSQKLYMEKLSDLSILDESKPYPILAVSSEMKKALSLAEKVANFQVTVLITGESGVGKEEVVRFIHNNSVRKDKPLIAVNCGAIPDSLLESELFGYEKGAFTGAMKSGKAGLIEAAEGGTLFLDEIGETPLDFQVKLLRFLETKEVRRVGSNQSRSVDVRVVAATNRSLQDMIEEGSFRQDLFYRLNVVEIDIPPLRDRKDDIMPLAAYFLARYNKRYGMEKKLTIDLIHEMEQHEWVGNVRELKNIVENMVVLSNNEYLQLDDLPWIVTGKEPALTPENMAAQEEIRPLAESMERLERNLLARARDKYVTTREIARVLGINQSTVVRKLKKYDLS